MNGFGPCCVLSVHTSSTIPFKNKVPGNTLYMLVIFKCLNESFEVI